MSQFLQYPKPVVMVITAADYNSNAEQPWDGSPFDFKSPCGVAAPRHESIQQAVDKFTYYAQPHVDDTDYATWKVGLSGVPEFELWPGDTVSFDFEKSTLTFVQHESNYDRTTRWDQIKFSYE